MAAGQATVASAAAAQAANTVQIAAATSAPAMDGVASTGTASRWAREDHVHPAPAFRAAMAAVAYGGKVRLLLGGSILNTVDFYHQAPTGYVFGGTGFKDFGLSTVMSVFGGMLGRHGLFFDGTAALNSYFKSPKVENVFIDNMATGYSIYSKGLAGGPMGASSCRLGRRSGETAIQLGIAFSERRVSTMQETLAFISTTSAARPARAFYITSSSARTA